MLQMGFHEQWMKELMPNATSCETLSSIVASHGRKSVGLVLEETQGLFTMCLIGLALALTVFMSEIFAHGIATAISLFFNSRGRRNEDAEVAFVKARRRQRF